MGLWTGIKYALNSTLGTRDCIPLDEQIANLKTLQASDNVYSELADTGIKDFKINNDGYLSFIPPVSVKFLQSGSVKIKFGTINTTEHRVNFHIYKNGEEVWGYTKTHDSKIENSQAMPVYATSPVIYLNRNDVLTFRFRLSDWRDWTGTVKYSYVDITNLMILADLKDNVLLIEEVAN